jgi:hypothetical protein
MNEPRTTLRPPSRAPWIVLLAVVAGLVAFAVVWRRGREVPPPAPTAPAAEAAPAGAPPAPVPTPDPARVRSLLEGLSTSPGWRRCLSEEDPLRRAAVLADNLAEGVSPRKALVCLAPPGGFAVERRGGRAVVAASSWRRYDEVAGMVAALDVRAVAGAYRDLAPALQAAYRALGYPGASLDAVVGKALRRLAAVPVPPDGAEVEVVEAKGALWAYADPRLEALGPAEKHLLRMGPQNARRVQQKVRELEAALGLAPAAGP